MADERHAAIIRISEELLLDFLQFQGGHILVAKVSDGLAGVVELIIEHPEMPVVKEGRTYPDVSPSYTSHFRDNGQLLSVERVKEEPST